MEATAGTACIVVASADGRELEVFVDPVSDGVPLVFHHGTPGSGRPLTVLVDAARACGLRWVSVTRPGFGGSTRLPDRRVVDIAADTEAVLDHLAVDRCVVAGWSGGGPHALACGARLGSRVDAVLVIAGCAPYPAAGLDWTAGMSDSERAEAEAAIHDPDRLRLMVEPRRAWYLTATGADLIGGLTGRFPTAEISAFASHATDFVACIAHALEPGVDAWLDDWHAMVTPWGFDLAEVAVPTVLWHGDLDDSCPLAHARWMLERLPLGELAVRRGDGHLSVGVRDAPAMFQALRRAASLS